MKLQHLDIENFGLFTGHVFDFDDNGFQLVVGPNEAGKTTLLQLIRELLFGFQIQNPYAFDAHTGEMAATATIELADGARVRFRRRKGRKNVVKGEFETTGDSVDEQSLDRLLGNANAELYQNVFGFSLAELSTGEKSLEHANLNEALYGGGLGGLANFQRILADLQNESDELFAPRGSTRTINSLLSKIKQQNKELREATVKPRDYEKLVKSCAQREEAMTDWRDRLDEFRRRAAHVERLSAALPAWLELAASQSQLAELDVPDGFSREAASQFDSRRQRREELNAELEEYRQEADDIRGRLERLTSNPDLIQRDAEIKQIAQRLSEIKGFRRDVPLRRQESETVKTTVQARLRELNPEWDFSHLEQFRTSLAQRDAVERLQQEFDELESAAQKLSVEHATVEKDLAALDKQLAGLKAGELPESLIQLVSGAARYEADRDNLQELDDRLHDELAEIDALQQRLAAPLGLAPEAVVDLPLPMEATVTDFRGQMDEARSRVNQSEERLTQACNDHAQAQDDLAQLDAEATVPDREQLLARRQRRDLGWMLIRRKYVAGDVEANDEIASWLDDDSKDLPDQYEREVAAADQLADERQEKSQAAARRDQLVVKIERLAKRVDAMETELEEANSRFAEIERQWVDLWAPCIFRPLSPAAMLDWLKQADDLRKQQQEAQSLREKIEKLCTSVEKFQSQLAQAFDDAADAPDRLLMRARERVEAARRAASQRETISDQLATKQRRLDELSEEISKSSRQQDDWLARWRRILEQFGFPSSWDVHLATRILNGLSEARSQYEKAEVLEKRIADMGRGVEQFEQQVFAICKAVAPELAKLPAEEAAVQLNDRLEAAKQASSDREKLQQDLEKNQRRLAAKQQQLSEIDETIKSLMQSAGAETDEEFRQVADRKERQVNLTAAIEDARKQIRTARGSEDEATFLVELKEADADWLAAEHRRLTDEIAAGQQSYDEARDANALEKNQLDQLNGESRAAGLAQDLESSRSQLAAAIDRWAPLMLAQAIMKQAVDKFERQHQPAMLGEVGRLFDHMTAGRYTEIQRKLDERGTLQVVDENGHRKEPHELSTGTREQLYLAIRLAYIRHYCQDAEPLPIVMDDVLVNFDDRRAKQTIEVLRDVAQQVQIVFLTCHDHMVELVAEAIPACHPIQLGTSSTELEQASVAASGKSNVN